MLRTMTHLYENCAKYIAMTKLLFVKIYPLVHARNLLRSSRLTVQLVLLVA